MSNYSKTQSELDESVDQVRMFPLRRFYFFIIFILTLLSPIGISLQTDDAASMPWKISATIQITSITITFLLLAWLPLLIPWLISLSPRLQNLLAGLRESGIEEIEAGILRIKLTSGVKEAAELYQKKLAEVKKDPANIEKSYNEALASLKASEALSKTEAFARVNEVCAYYDRIRKTMSSGAERTRLLTNLASILWPLMAMVDVNTLDIEERLKSTSGGIRLSAYKFLEYQPDLKYLNLLLSRAVGILEEPFGQYGALLALRRMVTILPLNNEQGQLVVRHLEWSARLDYVGDDRVYLMGAIISSVEKNNR